MFACMQKAVLKLKAKLKWPIQFACLNLKHSLSDFSAPELENQAI